MENYGSLASDRALLTSACVIKARVTRCLGELMVELKREGRLKQGLQKKNIKDNVSLKGVTLRSLGIDDNLAHAARKAPFGERIGYADRKSVVEGKRVELGG